MQLRKRNRKLTLYTKQRCFYCGDVLTRSRRTIDHATPRSRSGTDDKSNLLPACLSCNREKDSMTVEGYRFYLKRKNPMTAVIFFGER